MAGAISPEWRALYFPPADRLEVERAVPDGYILGISAKNRRSWKGWLMTDDPIPHRRKVVWKFDHITGGAKESALWALDQHATGRGHGLRSAPAMIVTADAEGNVLDWQAADDIDGGHSDRG
jgi:hypothetical protein